MPKRNPKPTKYGLLKWKKVKRPTARSGYCWVASCGDGVYRVSSSGSLVLFEGMEAQRIYSESAGAVRIVGMREWGTAAVAREEAEQDYMQRHPLEALGRAKSNPGFPWKKTRSPLLLETLEAPDGRKYVVYSVRSAVSSLWGLDYVPAGKGSDWTVDLGAYVTLAAAKSAAEWHITESTPPLELLAWLSRITSTSSCGRR